jgi:hypothetical protein
MQFPRRSEQAITMGAHLLGNRACCVRALLDCFLKENKMPIFKFSVKELPRFVTADTKEEAIAEYVELVRNNLTIDHVEAEEADDFGSASKNEQAYLALIERVRKISPEAAEYMEGDARKLPTFQADDRLGHAFHWQDTPQGDTFWWGINWELLKNQPGNQS